MQGDTAPRPPARCRLSQPGQKTWKSRTFGLIKSSCPCFSPAVSVTETWSIRGRPAFNCPSSTPRHGTGGSSHTTRQTSDGTDGCPRASLCQSPRALAGRQAGDPRRLGARRCPELPQLRAQKQGPCSSSDTPRNGFLPFEGQVTPKQQLPPKGGG